HFSGHGLTSRIDFSDENAIVLADFDDRHTGYSLSLRSIFEYFQATQFREQFFFIDACRNIPWEGEFRIGALRPERRDPSQPPVQQFVCYATSPGLKAVEIGGAGNERGAFTEVLLTGLRGTGSAKAWDMDNEQYLIRWGDLFTYIEREMRNKKISLDK